MDLLSNLNETGWQNIDPDQVQGNMTYITARDRLHVIFITRERAWYIISVVSVCMSVCPTITFESLDVVHSSLPLTISLTISSFSHIWYISREYGSSSYTESSGQYQGHMSNKRRKSVFPQCKTSIGINSPGSVKHRVARFACSIGFSLWLIECCYCHLCQVTVSNNKTAIHHMVPPSSEY